MALNTCFPTSTRLLSRCPGYRNRDTLPPELRRRLAYVLALAQMGDQDDAAKVLKGFGGAGVLELVEGDAGGHLPGRLHGEVRGSGVRPARPREEEQEGDRHSEVRIWTSFALGCKGPTHEHPATEGVGQYAW